MTAVERARRLYEEVGAPMLHARFSEYENRIAVGLAGEGSDCFGWDDEISRDHDYGAGFCLWLTEEDYARIGEALNRAYDEMLRAVAPEEGFQPRLAARRGARTIRSFYESILHCAVSESAFHLSEAQWLSLEDGAAASATNGAVFRDDLGVFSAIRGAIAAYYPQRVWRRRLVHELRMFSQYAQSNYARSMARRDLLTAGLCKARAAEAAMKLVFLLNRRFEPYYKWMRRAAGGLPRLAAVCGELDHIMALPEQSAAWESCVYDVAKWNHADAVEAGFERIAALIVRELAAQGLVTDVGTTFLEHLAARLAQEDLPDDERSRLIEQIVRQEWRQFDRVQNEGGRADCQDDWKTFEIMRSSQFLAWETPVLQSYLADLRAAEARGWNLLTEKYARMMESTAPERYAAMADRLPQRSARRLAEQEEVIAIHVRWNEAFAQRYPRYAASGRPLRTAEDTPWATSSETYLRGELGTYSDETFRLYRDMILRRRDAGESFVEEIARNQARRYGCASIAEAEERL